MKLNDADHKSIRDDLRSLADRVAAMSYHTFAAQMRKQADEIDDIFCKPVCRCCGAILADR